MTLPSWLGGNDPTGFLASAGLYARPIVGQPGDFEVQTEERRLRVLPGLVTVDQIAGPSLRSNRFEYLEQLAGEEISLGTTIDMGDVNRRIRKAQELRSPVGNMTQMKISTMAAPSSQLAGTVAAAYDNLVQTTLEGDSSERVFADAGVHLIRRRPELPHRAKLPSMALRLAYDRKLAQGETGHIISMNASGLPVFASSDGLSNGMYMLDAYIGPLLGCITPFVWAFQAIRPLGTVIYSLGCPVNGTTGEPSELLQLLSQQGTARSTSPPKISSRASMEAILWWTARLDRMFGVLSDPAVHTDQGGWYDPAKHLRALMSVEQLFRRVYSIQGAHRDTNARRVLLFTVLDTLKKLTGRDISTHCKPEFAKATLDRLLSEIPAPASELLIPGAERAVAALVEIADGFFLGREAGVDQVVLYHKSGRDEVLKLDNAVAAYVELLRNATHGYGTNRSAQVDRVDALLAQHNGQISHDIALLGYLYLLDVLTRPDVLQKVLYNGGRP